MQDAQMTPGMAPAPYVEESEISLVEILTAIGEEKTLIGLVALIATAIGLAVALLLPPVYTARTTLLPPQQGQSSSSAMLASLGALAGTAGLAAGIKAPEELYVGLLKTDSVANALVERYSLRERFNTQSLQDARKKMADKVRISADRKTTLIAVEVDDSDPRFAAQLANAHAEELRKLMTRLAVTEAQQRRVFFEQQIEKAKTDLAQAEIAVKRAQEKSGLISLDAQTQGTIGTAAQLRGQIVARQVQIQAMRPYAGPENQDLKRLNSELASLRAELARIEGGSPDLAPRAGRDDAQALANVRVFREMKFQEAIYAAMLQQLQMAKADEAKDAPLIQQVDMAVPPDRKSKPRRSLIVLMALALGLMAGLLIAFVRRAGRRARQDPDTAGRWQDFVDAWSWRRKYRASTSG